MRAALWWDCVSLILKETRQGISDFFCHDACLPRPWLWEAPPDRKPSPTWNAKSHCFVDILSKWDRWQCDTQLGTFRNPLWICSTGSLITLPIACLSIPNSSWLVRFQQWVVILVIQTTSRAGQMAIAFLSTREIRTISQEMEFCGCPLRYGCAMLC